MVLMPRADEDLRAVKSINQNVHRDALPDFRNLGVILRIVLVVLGLSLFVALAEAGSWSDVGARFLQVAAPVQPVLVLSILVLYAANRALHRLSYRVGVLVVFLTEIIVVTVVHRVGSELFAGNPVGQLERYWVFTAAVSARLGSTRTRLSTALMALNRKCGRMRACSACSRASESAGDKARLRKLK